MSSQFCSWGPQLSISCKAYALATGFLRISAHLGCIGIEFGRAPVLFSARELAGGSLGTLPLRQDLMEEQRYEDTMVAR